MSAGAAINSLAQYINHIYQFKTFTRTVIEIKAIEIFAFYIIFRFHFANINKLVQLSVDTIAICHDI